MQHQELRRIAIDGMLPLDPFRIEEPKVSDTPPLERLPLESWE